MDDTKVTPLNIFNSELFIKGTKVRVEANEIKYISASKSGTVGIDFLDVPDEKCYDICTFIVVTKNGFASNTSKSLTYEGEIDIRNLMLTPYGSALANILYGKEDTNE
jgi:hypothetical protein